MAHISERTCSSVKDLMQIKDVSDWDAEKIRKIWKTVLNRREARTQIDAILGTHGVEYLGRNKRTKDHVYYCNAGDTYATTIIFTGIHLRVNCWGDLVENNRIEERTSY